ncbi:MAG: hypothetical protein LBK58_05030 [Prevotellaceae bacterium]|jgi:hypothetical protein|nr:hypothetical protein [Prevotellaceae bacterium]
MKIRFFCLGIILAGMISAGIFMQSCSSGSSEDIQQGYSNEEDLASDVKIGFEKIGFEHNRGLDYVFEHLKNNLESKDVKLKSADNIFKSAEDIFKLVEDASIDFVHKSDYGKFVSKEKFSEIVNITGMRPLLKSSKAGTAINPEELITLTPKQVYYVDRYKNIMASVKKDFDITATIKKIKELETEINAKCSSDEIFPLLAATSVGRHSLQYWEENLYKWSALFMPEETQEIAAFVPRLKSNSYEVNTTQEEWEWFYNTLESMGESDGVGALFGGLIGSAAGGVGAVPGALSGACFASANAAMISLLHRWGIYQ